MPKLHTAYDIRDQPVFHLWSYFFFILMALALLVFYFTRKNRSGDMPNISKTGLAAGVFFLIIFLYFAKSDIGDYTRINKLFYNKDYSVVEGRVQDYHPMPASGHDDERFRVGVLYFTMCDYDESVIGYNHAASLGGVIRPNMYVRIWYPTYGRIGILRLETE